ncbi:MAG: site-2 protease family protein [Clostridia bacterium]|nr:site-2 protease family protein [Clostridia bacterium]
MTTILYILLALAVLLLMVLIHEFGHYIVGRMLNFKITEFSVGFGKALFSRKNKRGETISLRLFPLGAFVRLKEKMKQTLIILMHLQIRLHGREF